MISQNAVRANIRFGDRTGLWVTDRQQPRIVVLVLPNSLTVTLGKVKNVVWNPPRLEEKKWQRRTPHRPARRQSRRL